MQNLAQLLGKKYKFDIQYCRAVEVIESHWVDIVHDLAQFLRPRNIFKNKLVIACSNSAWLSEIDYFESEIVQKVNTLLKEKKTKIKITGVKLVISSDVFTPISKNDRELPQDIESRIQVVIEEKKKNGASLCKKCGLIWDFTQICKLCQLTSG